MHSFRPVALLLLLGSIALATPPNSPRLNTDSISTAEQRLQSEILDAISQRGGDLSQQHVHLVLAFSTGHYAQDPSAALAARELGWQLVKNVLVPGDRLSVAAWEMNLWKRSETPLVLTQAELSNEKAVRDLFPLTSRPNTQGGHDTERTIADLAEYAGEFKSNTVMVLLSNSAASVAPAGERTVGSDDGRYQAALTDFERLASTAASGASLQLPYTVTLTDGQTRERVMDVVLVVPRAFTAAALTSPRFERPNETPPGGGPTVNPVPFIAILVVLAAAFLIWRLLKGGKTAQVMRLGSSEGEWDPAPRYDLQGFTAGSEIVKLVGQQFDGGDRALVLPRNIRSLPGVSIARFERTRRGVKVVPLPPFAMVVDGAASAGREVVAGQQINARFEATHEFNSMLGTETVELPLTVAVE